MAVSNANRLHGSLDSWDLFSGILEDGAEDCLEPCGQSLTAHFTNMSWVQDQIGTKAELLSDIGHVLVAKPGLDHGAALAWWS